MVACILWTTTMMPHRPVVRAGPALLSLRRHAVTSLLQRGAQPLSYRYRSFASSSDAFSPPYSVLFYGTDDVSVATLKKLHANSQESEEAKRLVGDIHVICPTDRKVGNGKRTDPVPVKRFALDHGLGITHTPPQLKSLKNWRPEELLAQRFDVGVVVSFGYFLHPHLLHNLAHGAINMHPSLLPKYRGPAPIHHALLNGDSTTGVSVIEIDPRAFDVGRILLQKPFAIPPEITAGPLSVQLAEFGAECVLDTLRTLDESKQNARNQDDAIASHAPKIHLADGYVDLLGTADDIFHRWQALSDGVGITVRYQDKDVKLIELRRPTAEQIASVLEEEQRVGTLASGCFFFEKKLNALWLKCGGSSWLLVTKLQLADRKVGEAIDFANGFRLKRSLQTFHSIT